MKLSLIRLFKPIFRMIVVVSILLLIWDIYNGGLNNTVLPGLLIILCIPVLPTVYLFVEYLVLSINQRVEITSESISVGYKNGTIGHYFFKDIEVVKLYKSGNVEKGNYPMQSAEMYYHIEIFPRVGGKIVLGSVLSPGFDEAIDILMKNIKSEVIRTMYSTIYF